MLRAILTVLGVSQIWSVSKGSWRQWRKLRQMKKNYKAILRGTGGTQGARINSSNGSDITATQGTAINSSSGSDITAIQKESSTLYIDETAIIPFQTTATLTNNTARTIPLILIEYAKLVLELKEQEKTLRDAAKERMQNMASTAMVLCAVGFIPSCIASLGVLYDDDTGTAYEHGQVIVGCLLILLGVWCSFSILQTIFWYCMIPSYVHRKVLSKLVKPRRKTSIEIYHERTLNQLRQEEQPERCASASRKMISPQLIDKCLHDIRIKELDKKVIDSTNRIIVLQFLYPFHDIINWLMYPIMLLLQVIILYFLWQWPKNDEYDTSMKGQNIFSVWIFVLNVILVLATPSPRRTADQDDPDDNSNDYHDVRSK